MRVFLFIFFAMVGLSPGLVHAQSGSGQTDGRGGSGACSFCLSGGGGDGENRPGGRRSNMHSGSASHTSFQTAMEAYARRDYQNAEKLFWQVAHRDKNPEASYMLGHIAQKGLGRSRKPNYIDAVRHYSDAAEKGHIKAAVALGYIYSEAPGPTRANYEEAVKWYSIAARSGDKIAQNNLGRLLRDGKGWDVDKKMAAQWFFQAAYQGLPAGQVNLANMYLSGDGITRNEEKAAEWYEKAAKQGHTKAQYRLGILNRTGRGTPKNLPIAALWFELAAKKGHTEAQVELAKLHEAGDGVEKDLISAAQLYLTAAEQDHPEAQLGLGRLLELGENYPAALEWFMKAAEDGKNTEAAFRVASIYERGLLGGVPDFDEAIDWYTLAANNGNTKAQIQLGELYRSGTGVDQDYAESFKWYALAALFSPPGEEKDTAIVSRITVASRMNIEDREQARISVKQWQREDIGGDDAFVQTPNAPVMGYSEESGYVSALEAYRRPQQQQN